MRVLLPCGSHRTLPGSYRGETGDGNTQSTPRKQLWSERIADLIDGQALTHVMGGETESEAGSVLPEPPGSLGSELLPAQVSVAHRDPEPES